MRIASSSQCKVSHQKGGLLMKASCIDHVFIHGVSESLNVRTVQSHLVLPFFVIKSG